MSGSARRKAKLRQRARAWKAQVNRAPRPRSAWGTEPERLPDGTLLDDCPDPANHMVCPASGGEHDWYKPHPRPRDHKYECADCGHYNLDDYK